MNKILLCLLSLFLTTIISIGLSSCGSEEEDDNQNTNKKNTFYLTCPDNKHPHIIDLGLPSGTKWACCNVGATKPDDYGGHYAWGETEQKSYYDWRTYIHCDGTEETCHDIGSDIAGTQYDVAHVKWGKSWVMPSQEQFEELYKKCTIKWTALNGIGGAEITGVNGGKIFFAATGERWQDDYAYSTYGGRLWTSNSMMDSWSLKHACCFYFYMDEGYCYYNIRSKGPGVRPVWVEE